MAAEGQVPPPTSAVLMSLSKHIAVRCAKVNPLPLQPAAPPLLLLLLASPAVPSSPRLQQGAQHHDDQEDGSVGRGLTSKFDRRGCCPPHCARAQVNREYMACKNKDGNPEACLQQGDAVTSCVIDL